MNVHNLVSITGRLVADPELKTTQSGISCCRFCVAVSRPYQKDKEQQADFIKCQAWKTTAEFVSRHFGKGTPVTVVGNLRNNNYTDQNGVKHYSMEVLADNVGFVPKNADSCNTTDKTAEPENVEISDLSDFEEILEDGKVPF